MSGLSRRSVEAQLRVLGLALLLLFPVVAAATLWTTIAQSRDIAALTGALGPAFDANNAALIDMTEANAGWSQLMGGTAPLTRYRLKHQVVDADLNAVARAIASPALDRQDQQAYGALLAEQRAAVAAWFRAAEAADDGKHGSLGDSSTLEATALERFRLFRDSNRQLFEEVREQRDLARQGSRTSVQFVLAVQVVTALLAMAIVLSGWRMLQQSISRPLERLRAVVSSQRDGEREAQADTGQGAEEVRDLARDFNGLTRSNTVLREQQALVLLAHQLALDVARGVQAAPDIHHAMRLVCAMLGEGLGVDRVLLYTHDRTGLVDERVQWRRYDLPDLPPLPPSLAQEVQAVNDQLRREASVFAPADFLAPEIQAEPRAERFARATGAHSLLMAPVGTGEQGLGVLCLIMVDAPRRWRRYEIQAVQQCAGYLAEGVASLRLTQMQEEQVRRLTEIDRQKTDFMATVSHELRTPLTSINGYVELLEDGDYGPLTASQLNALDIIDRNTTRLRGLIEDLLVLNKIEATGLASSLQEVSVNELVAGVGEMLRPVAERGRVDLLVEAADPDVTVSVDRGQLERALINLGSNAVKFTPAGGRATIRARRRDSAAVIDVIDTGIGIPVQDQERLFTRFFRASNASAAAIPGTGLGLAIVQAILEGHHGHLDVHSVEGQGTTMSVVLPLAGDRTGNDQDRVAV